MSRATPNRLRPIPHVARCACGEIVISREAMPGELRWCADCRGFVEDVISASSVGVLPPTPHPTLPAKGIDLPAHLVHVEASLIESAVERAGSIGGAARLLGLNRTTLSEKIRRLSVSNPRFALLRGEWQGPPRAKAAE